MNKNEAKYFWNNWPKTFTIVWDNWLLKMKDERQMKAYYLNYTKEINKALQKKKRKSDTAFIFGSGGSLRDFTREQWEEVALHDVISFNWFAHQQFVNVDYYLIKDISYNDTNRNVFLKEYYQFNNLLQTNWNRYQDCLFLLQEGPFASTANNLLYYRILPQESHITRFSGYYGFDLNLDLPFLSIKSGTLLSVIQFALLSGWKKIVLAGVDLYNRDYFWFKGNELRGKDKIRGASQNDIHNTVQTGLIKVIQNHILPYAKSKGIEILIQNPESLLAEILPVYEFLDDFIGKNKNLLIS